MKGNLVTVLLLLILASGLQAADSGVLQGRELLRKRILW